MKIPIWFLWTLNSLTAEASTCSTRNCGAYVVPEVMLRSSVKGRNDAAGQRCRRNIISQSERRKAIVDGSLFHGRLEAVGVASALVWLSICALWSRSTSA